MLFGFGNITIRDAQDKVEDLVSYQRSMLETVRQETAKLDASERKAKKLLRLKLQNIVLVDDNDRYEALSRASIKAQTGKDFSATVARWTREDEANRAERKALDEKWGSRATVAADTREAKADLDLTSQAEQEVRDEIEAFELATDNFAAHNEKYPTAEITDESYEDQRDFSFWSWLNYWTLGLVFNKCAADHHAYKVIHAYDKEYGDYHEDALNIHKLRETHKSLVIKKAEEQGKYSELFETGRRMDELDSSYKGPENIAVLIREQVLSLVLDNTAFCNEMVNELKSDDAYGVVLEAARLRAYDVLDVKLRALENEVDETYGQLKKPEDTLEEGEDMIPYERVSFDFTSIERKLEGAVEESTAALKVLSGAREDIEDYVLSPKASYTKIESDVSRMGRVKASVEDLTFDLSDLEHQVKNAIEEEEARREAERLERLRREAERRAEREAEAKRLRDMLNKASTPTVSRPRVTNTRRAAHKPTITNTRRR